jgi:hypothetical protein
MWSKRYSGLRMPKPLRHNGQSGQDKSRYDDEIYTPINIIVYIKASDVKDSTSSFFGKLFFCCVDIAIIY